jgi:hypothetical protein
MCEPVVPVLGWSEVHRGSGITLVLMPEAMVEI